MSRSERKRIQEMYIRVCRDSRFLMEMIQAAHFAAKLLEVSALEVWLALGLDDMERISNGTHPCLNLPR